MTNIELDLLVFAFSVGFFANKTGQHMIFVVRIMPAITERNHQMLSRWQANSAGRSSIRRS
jgi:hypothetical protein